MKKIIKMTRKCYDFLTNAQSKKTHTDCWHEKAWVADWQKTYWPDATNLAKRNEVALEQKKISGTFWNEGLEQFQRNIVNAHWTSRTITCITLFAINNDLNCESPLILMTVLHQLSRAWCVSVDCILTDKWSHHSLKQNLCALFVTIVLSTVY